MSKYYVIVMNNFERWYEDSEFNISNRVFGPANVGSPCELFYRDGHIIVRFNYKLEFTVVNLKIGE